MIVPNRSALQTLWQVPTTGAIECSSVDTAEFLKPVRLSNHHMCLFLEEYKAGEDARIQCMVRMADASLASSGKLSSDSDLRRFVLVKLSVNGLPSNREAKPQYALQRMWVWSFEIPSQVPRAERGFDPNCQGIEKTHAHAVPDVGVGTT